MTSRLFIGSLLVICPLLAAAQDIIYESKDKAGPVFSDTPARGAKPIEQPPSNLSQDVPPPQLPSPPAAPAPYYKSIAVTSPVNEGTVHTNTGAFKVRITISPTLRLKAGDRLKLTLDGRLLTPNFRNGNVRMQAVNWNHAADPNNVAHTLQAAIVDRSGAVLLASEPITFYAHRATRSSGKR